MKEEDPTIIDEEAQEMTREDWEKLVELNAKRVAHDINRAIGRDLVSTDTHKASPSASQEGDILVSTFTGPTAEEIAARVQDKKKAAARKKARASRKRNRRKK